MQRINYSARDRLRNIVNMPERKMITFTEWHKFDDGNTDGRHLTYLEFPSEFLICHRKGCKSPIGVLTINDHVLPTYRAACEALGLLGDDKEDKKTLLWKTITSTLQSKGKIVLAVVSSGIASLLLIAGCTAHLRFKIPLELADESMCHIKKTQLGTLLTETDLIIWDEAPMNDPRCFEAFDKSLRDLIDTSNVLFGGKMVVLRDFRQTLPVKKELQILS
ncbi:DNA helicase [Tanacetum coccineum]|uniref:ATP-dependent DNA helicase n=1 Tax=Tanacetum coccineum TaxID=301880 RepID=A0ABQ5DPB3_9ASTR